MNRMTCLLVVLAALVAAGEGRSQDRRRLCKPNCPPAFECPSPYAPPVNPNEPNAPSPQAQPPQSNAFSEALASAGESGTQPAASYLPGFFGDILGGCVASQVFLGGSGNAIACMPNPATSSGFNITEGESPRPQNRVYYNYNFFGNVAVDVGANNFAIPVAQVSRHVIGFEKTLFDDRASVGLRLPFLSIGGDPAYQAAAVCDMSIITKWAFIDNPETGNVLTGGMVIRVPTSSTLMFRDATGQRTLAQDRVDDVGLQPFVGYIYNITDNLYFQGFHSIAIPTARVDVTFMSNDVGFGYWLLRRPDGNLIQAIVPTLEMHVNTPFSNRTLQPIHMEDQVTLTSGAYFVLPRSAIGLAVGVPFAGLNTIEAIASYQLRF